MSGYRAEWIEKKGYFAIKPTARGRGKRKVCVVGFDTEADDGRPFMLQMNWHGESDDTRVYQLDVSDGEACLKAFMLFVEEICVRRDTEYLIFGWNLAYEWTQLFGHIENEAIAEVRVLDTFAISETSEATGNVYDWEIWNDKRQYATIRNRRTHRTIKVLDGYRFFTTSLDKAGGMLDIGRKHEKPATFSLAMRHDPAFLAYAKQDAWLTRKIGELIVSMHEDYDVPTCITAPQFATRVFKHHFLDGEIPLAEPDLEQAGLWSYHGGKNGYYLGQPMQIPNVYAYDITSAYPEAMRQLPDPVQSAWVVLDRYAPGEHALWCVSGTYRRCKYRGFLKHEMGFAASGPITDLWVTSYELDSMLAHGEFDMTACHGYAMQGPTGSGPLVRYVDTFFALKAKSKGALREAAKLFLNSLYGKFFQKVPKHDIGWTDEERVEVYIERHAVPGEPAFEAGGLYHPPIASLITGFVRAKMHGLEHRYDAMMTSTDGFFARKAPLPEDVGSHLGGLTVERGHLIIWRERLYAFRVHGKVSKSALHGFRGSLAELLRVPLEPGIFRYTAQQMITLKMAMQKHHDRRFRPGSFATLPYELLIKSQPEGP